MSKKVQLLDPYKGPPTPTRNEEYEFTQDEIDDEIISARLFSPAGRDVAYEMGITEHFLPAPKGGWSPTTPREELLP